MSSKTTPLSFKNREYVLTGRAVMALAVTYLPMFLPPVGGKQASGTEAPAPVPLA